MTSETELSVFVKVIVLSLLAFTFMGCGIEEGRVVGKEHQPEHDFWYLMPLPHTQCTPVGKTTSCTTYYTYIPIYYRDDEDWVLKLKDGDKTGTVYVSEKTYNKVQKGDWYRSKDAERKDPKKELKRGGERDDK